MMAKSTNNPNAVTFSAGSQIFIGAYGTPPQALPLIGLLAADVAFNAEQTMRQKMDRFPEVVVAESIQGQSANIDLTAREWTDSNLQLGLGLESEDVTAYAGGDQRLSESVSFNGAGVAALAQPLKAGETLTLTSDDETTTYNAGTDYVALPRDLQGRTLIYRLEGNIPAGTALRASYTYQERGRTVMPVGRRATVVYRTVRVVEEFTNGGRAELIMWRARVGIRGAFSFNSAENSGDIPLVAQALFDPAKDELASLINYAGA